MLKYRQVHTHLPGFGWYLGLSGMEIGVFAHCFHLHLNDLHQVGRSQYRLKSDLVSCNS